MAGTYTVQLKVTDSLDKIDITTAYINVGSKVTTARACLWGRVFASGGSEF